MKMLTQVQWADLHTEMCLIAVKKEIQNEKREKSDPQTEQETKFQTNFRTCCTSFTMCFLFDIM